MTQVNDDIHPAPDCLQALYHSYVAPTLKEIKASLLQEQQSGS
jgi:hypothetical protein